MLVALLPSPLHEVTFPAPAESTSSSPATTRLPRGEHATRAFFTAFSSSQGGAAHFKPKAPGDRPGFWQQAEMIEVVEDACEALRDPAHEALLARLWRGFSDRYGSRWTWNRYNDDVMWMVIASLRAHEITGDRLYLRRAKRHFDDIYRRAWSQDYGGGLWWRTPKAEKNACVNAPAAIAAAKLARALDDPAYLRKAEDLYGWLRQTLFDPKTGAVRDRIFGESRDPSAWTTAPETYTYNQGTFIGAADLLHRATGRRAYYDDALLALCFARDEMCRDGVLPSEGSGGDGGGFKGIFARYAVAFARHNGIADFDDWFEHNAAVAWSNRNEDGLIGEDWSARSDDELYAFDCSSAVSLLLSLEKPAAP